MAPDLCTITGILYGMSGSPLKGAALRVRNIYIPLAVGTSGLVLDSSRRVISDEDGIVTFTLIQGAQVRIELPGIEQEITRTVTVPLEATCDLVALLYPYLLSVAWDDAGPLSKEVDDLFSISATGTYSDGTTENITRVCTFEHSVEGVLSGSGGSLRAVSAGSTDITITAVDTDALAKYQFPNGDVIERIDAPDITLPDALTVVVV